MAYSPQQNRWFSVIWGAIFAVVGFWLIDSENGFVTFLGILSMGMVGLSAVQFFKGGES